jgi:hypothetical protein
MDNKHQMTALCYILRGKELFRIKDQVWGKHFQDSNWSHGPEKEVASADWTFPLKGVRGERLTAGCDQNTGVGDLQSLSQPASGLW